MTRENRNYTPEFKQEAIKLALNSPSILSATHDLGIPEATLHAWVQKAKRSSEAVDPDSAKPVNVGELVKENQQLKTQQLHLEQEKAILKNGGNLLRQGARVKYGFIKEHKNQFAMSLLCEVLDVSSSGYYDWLARTPGKREQANSLLDQEIMKMYTRHKKRDDHPDIVKINMNMSIDSLVSHHASLFKLKHIQPMASRLSCSPFFYYLIHYNQPIK